MTIKTDQVADAFVAVPGVFSEKLEQPSGTIRINSTSPAKIYDQNITIPVAGVYRITLDTRMWKNQAGASTVFQWDMIVDEATVPVNVDADDWKMSLSSGEALSYQQQIFVATTRLSAGTHNFRVYCKQLTSAASYIDYYAPGAGADTPTKVRVDLLTGSGAGGTRTTTLSGSNSVTLAAANTVYDLLSTTITCVTGETILLPCTGQWKRGSASLALHAEIRAYVNGVSSRAVDQKISALSTGSVGTDRENASFTFAYEVPLSGAYTFEIKAVTNADHTDTTATLENTYAKVIQFRGGQVPWENDGVAVLSTPRAINIVGGVLTAADDGTGKLNLGLTGIAAGPGVSIEMLNKSPTGTYSTTSSSWTDIDAGSGALSQTFTVPTTGNYLIMFNVGAWASTSWSEARFRLVLDALGTPQYVGPDDKSWSAIVPVSAAGVVEYVTLFTTVSLTAGSHTIKPQWKRVQGTGTLNADTNNVFLARGTLVVGSGAGGTLDTAVSLANNLTVDVLEGSTPKTILSTSVTTIAGEKVQVTVTLPAYGNAGGAAAAFARLCIDGTWTDRLAGTTIPTTGYGSLSFSYVTGPLSAGAHTILLGGTYNGQTWLAIGSASTSVTSMTVTQHRGTAVLGTNATSGGDAIEALKFLPGGAVTTTSGTFVDITGASGSFTARVAGQYLAELTFDLWVNTAGYTTAGFRIIVDAGTTSEQIVGPDDKTWQLHLTESSEHQPGFCSALLNLTAGAHTIKLQWRRIDGSGTLTIDAYAKVLLQAVSGSGVGGNVVAYAAKTTDQTGIAANATTKVTGLDLAFTASTNEDVEIFWEIFSGFSASSPGHRALFLRVDGGTWEFQGGNYTGYHAEFSGSRILRGLSAGSHTVEFAVRHDFSPNTLSVYATSEMWGGTGVMQSRSWAVQSRGGLVPVQKDSVNVLSTPRAFDFQGPLSVTDVAGVATIKMDPAVSAPGSASDQEESPTSTVTVNSDSGWTAISPTTGSWSLNALQAGLHRIDWDLLVFIVYNSTNVTFELKIVVDEGTGTEQTIGGGAGLWRYRTAVGNDVSGTYYPIHRSEFVTLAAGLHTFKGYCRGMGAASQGSISVCAQGGTRIALSAITGSGAGGEIVTTDGTQVGPYAVSNTDPTYHDVLTKTITVAAGERVLVVVNGFGRTTTSSSYMILRAYNSTTSEIIGKVQVYTAGTSQHQNLSFVRHTSVLTAGSHTIKLQAAKASGSDWGLVDYAMEVVQLRGGLVPIKQDNTLVQDKPQAINAIGPGLQATNVAGQVNLSVQSAAEGVTYLADGLSTSPVLTTSYADTGLEVSVTVVQGENLFVNAALMVYRTGGSEGYASFKVVSSIDGDLFENEQFYTGVNTYHHSNQCLNAVVGPLSAGTHTIKIQGKVASGGTANGTLDVASKLRVSRLRGGYVQPENTPILSYNSASVINVAAAPGASSELSCQLNDGVRRRATAPLAINLATSGEGGLDTGTEANSTWYYCYLVPKASDDTQLVALCSVTPPTTGPTGYSKWKYIGAVRNDASGNLLPWYQNGSKFRYKIPQYAALTAVGGVTQFDASAYVPATAFDCGLTMTADYGSTWAVNYIYVRGEPTYWMAAAAAGGDPFNATWVEIPILGSPRGFDYYLQGVGATGYFIFSSWTDGYLSSPQSALQAKYQADTKSPKGTWATVSTVNFAARPGQPTFSRLTLQDGKARVAASSTLAWAIANGVADLGYDEAASQGNSKWLYFYAVPKSGDDNQFSIRASDNDPTVGPTGYTNWKLVWTTYIDGSGNLLKVTQAGNRFSYRDGLVKKASLGAGSDGSPVNYPLTSWVPASASQMHLFMQAAQSSNGGFYAYVDGETNAYASTFTITSVSETIVFDLPLPTSPKQFQYKRGNVAWAEFAALGWTDEYIDADGSSGNVIAGVDPDAIHKNVAGEINALTSKATPVAGDLILIEDSAASNAKKKALLSALPIAAHATTHNAGGSDALAIDAAAGTGSLRTLGTGATAACAGNDSRLSDARTPTTHATSHKNGGSDEVGTATPTANAIPKANASGRLNSWIDTYLPPVTLSGLASVPTTGLPSGAQIYVTDIDAVYQFESSGSYTPDGLGIIAGLDGGYWIGEVAGRWDDIQGDVSQGAAGAALTYEAFRDTAYMMYFMRHDQNDTMHFRFQLNHRWKYDTDVKLHIHFVPMADPTGSQDINFDGYYAWSKVGGTAIPALSSWTTFNVTYAVAPGDVYKQAIKLLATITPPSEARESSFLLVYLRRNSGASDTYTTSKDHGTAQANVGVLGVDVHYRSNKHGSIAEIPT